MKILFTIPEELYKEFTKSIPNGERSHVLSDTNILVSYLLDQNDYQSSEKLFEKIISSPKRRIFNL